MKPIEEMNLAECLEEVELLNGVYEYDGPTRLALRINELTRWIPVEERLPTEEDVMNTNDDIHSYMNGLLLWLVAHESGRLDYEIGRAHV